MDSRRAGPSEQDEKQNLDSETGLHKNPPVCGKHTDFPLDPGTAGLERLLSICVSTNTQSDSHTGGP